MWRQKSEPRRVVLPGYLHSAPRLQPPLRIPPPFPSRPSPPQLLLHHLLHLLDDAIPSFIISCTSDFENSNNFLLPPGWRGERGGGRGMAGARGEGGGGRWFYPLRGERWFRAVLMLVVLARRRGGSRGGGGGEPTVRGRRVSSLYKVRATSIIISREPRQDGAPDRQTPYPHVPTESLFKPSLTSSCFLLSVSSSSSSSSFSTPDRE